MEVREGYCEYCGEGRMVEVSEEATQEAVNRTVTENCDCIIAIRVRVRKKAKGRMHQEY